MNNELQIVEATTTFRRKIAAIAKQKIGRKKIKAVIQTSYPTINRLINSGFVRYKTLKKFVEKIEGEKANVEDYIKPL